MLQYLGRWITFCLIRYVEKIVKGGDGRGLYLLSPVEGVEALFPRIMSIVVFLR